MNTRKKPEKNRLKSLCQRRETGSTLALTAVVLAMLLGFMGIAIYLGLQAYAHNELQKAATTAALAGAANYYQGFDNGGNPVADAGAATATANAVLGAIIAQSPPLQMMGAGGGVSGAAGGVVSVQASGSLATPVLSLINVNQITVQAEAHAVSLMYSPTAASGQSITLNANSMKEFVQELNFPLLGGLAFNELKVVHEGSSQWKGWSVAAGSGGGYMSLAQGGSYTVFGGPGECRPGVIYGSAVFDLDAAGINKAARLRFVDDLVWDSRRGGCGDQYLDSTDTVLTDVQMLGYASACPTAGNCPVPQGFQQVQ